MPSASATWRVSNSSLAASPGPAPNFDARLSFECSDETRRRTQSVRSLAATPSRLVARTIFSSSSRLSSEKVRTPCVKYASSIASSALTGCMKQSVASGSVRATRRTSPIDATS